MREQTDELGRVDDRDQRIAIRPVTVQPLDIGEHDELGRPEGDGERRGGRVGVHVERLPWHLDVGGDGRDHRNASRVHLGEHGGRIDLDHIAHQTDVDDLAVDQGAATGAAEQAGVLPRDRRGERTVLVDQADQFAADLSGQDHAHDIHRLGGRDAVAADELAGDAEPLEHRRDLRAAAVHDDRLQAHMTQIDHVLGEGALATSSSIMALPPNFTTMICVVRTA